MACKDRIIEDVMPVSYTCKNRRFWTDTRMGYAHGKCATLGSVFAGPLARNDSGYSLWLEHVTNLDGDPFYWLMWYDPEGCPTIPLSGIMDRNHIADMSRQLAGFIP
jgi:hypothetical protein